MSEHSRETDGKFSCCFVNVVCNWECQRGCLASTASERSSSPLWCDVRARSKNDPGVRDGWQTSRREENQHAAGSWRSIICQGQFGFFAVSCWCTAFVSPSDIRTHGIWSCLDTIISHIPSFLFYTQTLSATSDIHKEWMFFLLLYCLRYTMQWWNMSPLPLWFVSPTCISCGPNWKRHTMFDLYSWSSRAAAAELLLLI